jgi:pimeloyl-ACP methyl ester carboxylesterase
VTLHFESTGSGRPLLLLHGFGATLFTWRLIAPALAAKHRVVCVDLLGFGGSPKPSDGDYSLRHQSELVQALMREHGLDGVTLVGHSFGGGVALMTALQMRWPAVRSLVLIDAPAYPQPLPLFLKTLRTRAGPFLTETLPAEEQVRAVLRLAYYDDAAVLEESVHVYAQSLRSEGGAHALVQTARELVPPDLEAISRTYPQLDVPALLIYGREDQIVPFTTGERLARALRDARLVVLDRTGHIPQEENPAVVLRLIEGFLDEAPTHQL